MGGQPGICADGKNVSRFRGCGPEDVPRRLYLDCVRQELLDFEKVVLRRSGTHIGEGLDNSQARDRKFEELKGSRRRSEIRRSRGDGRSSSKEMCQCVCVARNRLTYTRTDRFLLL